MQYHLEGYARALGFLNKAIGRGLLDSDPTVGEPGLCATQTMGEWSVGRLTSSMEILLGSVICYFGGNR